MMSRLQITTKAALIQCVMLTCFNIKNLCISTQMCSAWGKSRHSDPNLSVLTPTCNAQFTMFNFAVRPARILFFALLWKFNFWHHYGRRDGRVGSQIMDLCTSLSKQAGNFTSWAAIKWWTLTCRSTLLPSPYFYLSLRDLTVSC